VTRPDGKSVRHRLARARSIRVRENCALTSDTPDFTLLMGLDQGVRQRLDSALAGADSWFTVYSRLSDAAREGEQDRYRALVWAFGYDLISPTDVERREREGSPFGALFESRRGGCRRVWATCRTTTLRFGLRRSRRSPIRGCDPDLATCFGSGASCLAMTSRRATHAKHSLSSRMTIAGVTWSPRKGSCGRSSSGSANHRDVGE
jgi:hypothetical protein